MLMPKKVKHRKTHRGRMRGLAFRGSDLSFGSVGLKAKTGGLLSARQIEAARRAMTRYVQRGGKIWIRVFPDKPITQKASDVPMGKGKGDVDHYSAVIRPGRMLFEIDGIEETLAIEAMKRAAHKLSVATTIVKR